MYILETKDAYKLFHQGTLALARAERQGIRVDIDYIRQKKQELDQRIEEVEEELKQTKFYRQWTHSRGEQGPNINSNPQLKQYLYKVRKETPPKETASGAGSTDEKSLKELNIPGLNYILEIRKLKKLKNTYLDQFEREAIDGYIHPFFNLHTVQTYRSSSNNPNFQNIPVRDEEAKLITRRALFPRPGHQLLEIDYSGLEFNINACYSKDPVMLEYCRNPNSDPHADVAEQVFLIKYDPSITGHKVLRSAAKNGFTFPELYGDYYKNCAIGLACNWGELKPAGRWKKKQGIELEDLSLSDHLINNDIKSLFEYTDHIKKVEGNFFDRFAIHRKYMEETYNDYLENGVVKFYTGFSCKGVLTRNQVLNCRIQGSAFHILLKSFIKLDAIMRQENWDTRLIGQIHDSIVFDVHPDELEQVTKTAHEITTKEVPAEWTWIIVPLKINMELSPVDCSWADKKDYNFSK
jgi:DNA polymerase-1